MAEVKINRRQFLISAGAGALALGLAPGLLSAAGRNVAPMPAGNPLFTGELGVYEGFPMTGVWYDEPAEWDYYQGEQWTAAQRELFTRGEASIKVTPGRKAEWIPFNKIHRRG